MYRAPPAAITVPSSQLQRTSTMYPSTTTKVTVPKGDSRSLACAPRAPDLSLPAAVPKDDSRCLACAPRAPHLSLPLSTIDPLYVRHSEYLHSAAHNRAAQRMPCAKTQSSGPITDLELIKSRDCSCTPLCSRAASQLRRLCFSTIWYQELHI